MFKKVIKTETKNYRPFSIMHLISKGILKAFHEQTYDYLRRNELLHSYHSGFRANHSAYTCLPQSTDMILNSAENGLYTGLILIDPQKAFDTLNLKILLEKIKCLGF